LAAQNDHRLTVDRVMTFIWCALRKQKHAQFILKCELMQLPAVFLLEKYRNLKEIV
jgi:hypothetical protein